MKNNILHDDSENYQHTHAIQKLAKELHMSTEEILPSYMEVLATLKKEAKISTFLPVLVSRSVKAKLQRRQ